MGNDLNLDHFRTLLEEQRSELSALIAGARDQGKPVELDQSRVGRLSRMDAMRDQAMAQETERRRQTGLTRVASALNRLDEDSYGYCLLCDEEIPIKRLEFDPSVTTCVNCAQS